MIATFVALLVAVDLDANDNWPRFRGPGARGVSENANLPVRWSATENVQWKTDLPGRGWSSPVVWGNRVFLSTVMLLTIAALGTIALAYFGSGEEDSA